MSSGRPRRNPFVRWWPILLVALLTGAFVVDRVLFSPSLEPYSDRREMMDTWVSVTVYDTDDQHARVAIDAAFARMAEVVSVASIYDPEAEAARLNAAGRLPSPSAELVRLIDRSILFYTVSRGAFDVAIGPLLALWRYDPEADVQFWELSPEAQQAPIAAAIALGGADRIVIHDGPPAEIVLPPGMSIDLGGIAKGYAVDQALDALDRAGIDHALVNAGGDIGVLGGRPGGEPWEIALRDSEDDSKPVAQFALTDGAIATSGNYLRYYDPNAQVGHIMDPRTGYSAHAASSATVIAPTCTEADALATAVFVLGPADGIELVDGLDKVEAMVLGYEDPTMIARSRHLDRYEIREKDGA